MPTCHLAHMPPEFKLLVPKTGLEPVSLSAADFKSDVYTIPPLGPTRV